MSLHQALPQLDGTDQRKRLTPRPGGQGVAGSNPAVRLVRASFRTQKQGCERLMKRCGAACGDITPLARGLPSPP